jgi:hypothetical protein
MMCNQCIFKYIAIYCNCNLLLPTPEHRGTLQFYDEKGNDVDERKIRQEEKAEAPGAI